MGLSLSTSSFGQVPITDVSQELWLSEGKRSAASRGLRVAAKKVCTEQPLGGAYEEMDVRQGWEDLPPIRPCSVGPSIALGAPKFAFLVRLRIGLRALCGNRYSLAAQPQDD